MATSPHARLDRLERKAVKLSRILIDPPPIMEVCYLNAEDGAPEGEPEFTYAVDPLATVKAKLAAQAPKCSTLRD